jgi:tetratricopeptide (TPR) repeat protein
LRPRRIFPTIAFVDVISGGHGDEEKLGPTSKGNTNHLVRMTWSCVAVLAVSPVIGAAQSPSKAGISPAPDTHNYKVSAHELQIPAKAREAFNRGTQLLAAKESKASIVHLRRAIEIYPDFYEAYYKIGLANVILQRYSEARSAFESSIELSKGRYAPSQFGLAIVLSMQKDFDGAEEAVRAGLDEYPADAAGNFTLGWVQFRAGRVAEAEKSARQAILSNPNLADAYLLLAQVHLRQSDLTALLSDVDAYLRLDPEGGHNAQARAIRIEAEQLLAKQRAKEPVVAKNPTPDH